MSEFAPLLPRYPILPTLFPRQTVSLLVGAPYSGKTALLLPALASYLSRGEMLDLAAPRHPDTGIPMLARTGCLTCDQTAADLQDHLGYLGLLELTPARFPIVSWQDARDHHDRGDHSHLGAGLDPSLADLYALFPEPRPQFLIIEDLQTLMPSGKVFDRQDVKRFHATLKSFCIEHDVTVLATVPQAKAQPDQPARSATERVFGSIMWVNTVESVLSLDAPGEDTSAGTRVLRVITRRAAPRTLWFDFDSNHQLVPTLTASDWRLAMADRLLAVTEGEPLPKSQFVSWGQSLGVGETMVEDWLTASTMPRGSLLERVKRGTYRRPYAT